MTTEFPEEYVLPYGAINLRIAKGEVTQKYIRADLVEAKDREIAELKGIVEIARKINNAQKQAATNGDICNLYWDMQSEFDKLEDLL